MTPVDDARCRRPPGLEHARSRPAKSVDIFVRESSAIMPALFIGSLVAGAIQVLVPRDDTYADLFEDDLDAVSERLDESPWV